MRSNRAKSLLIAMAKASSFSSASCAMVNSTVTRPGSIRTPGGRFSNFCVIMPTRRFHKQLRMFDALCPEPIDDLRQVAAALQLVKPVLTLGEAAEPVDEVLAIGQSISADAIGDAGRQDLLRSAAADAEQELQGGAIDERAGKSLEFPDHRVEFAIPRWFGRHGSLTMLVRTCAECNPVE